MCFRHEAFVHGIILDEGYINALDWSLDVQFQGLDFSTHLTPYRSDSFVKTLQPETTNPMEFYIMDLTAPNIYFEFKLPSLQPD